MFSHFLDPFSLRSLRSLWLISLCRFRGHADFWEVIYLNIYITTYFRQFDPRHEREADIFCRLGYIDVQHLAPRIRARVLMGTGLMDTICPPSTQFAAYNKIRSPKDVLIYPDYAHEVLPGFYDRVFQFMQGL